VKPENLLAVAFLVALVIVVILELIAFGVI
jgi:hypothetical protein